MIEFVKHSWWEDEFCPMHWCKDIARWTIPRIYKEGLVCVECSFSHKMINSVLVWCRRNQYIYFDDTWIVDSKEVKF